MSATSTVPAPVGSPLVRLLAQYWWLLLLRGIAAIVFGVLAFIWPGITLVTLVLFWARSRWSTACSRWQLPSWGGNMGHRWWLALVGLCRDRGRHPHLHVAGRDRVLLLLFIAAWAIVLGIFQIIGAIQLRKEIDNEWTLGSPARSRCCSA
jgi:hypothetical protein